jgi:carboxymethylenebutenolidase
MKKLLLFTLMTLSAVLVFGQAKKMTICHDPSATQRFAMLASDKKFVVAHANPRPYHFQSSVGKAITYKTADGKDANAFELKAK